MKFSQNNFLNKNYSTLVLIFVLFIPVYFYLNNFAPVSSPFVRGIKDIILVILFISGLFFVKSKRKLNTDILLLLLLFLYIIFNAFLISGLTSVTFFALRSYLILPILNLYIFMKLKDTEITKVYSMYIYSASILAAIHLIQIYLFKDFLVLNAISDTYTKGSFFTRPASFVNNPNTLAYMNMVAIIISVILKKGRFLIPLLFVSTLLTGCRSAVLLGPFAIIITMYVKNKINIINIIFATLLLVVGGGSLNKYFPVIYERFISLLYNGDPRLVMWQSVITYLSDNSLLSLLFGLGIGNIGSYGPHVNAIPVYIPGICDLEGLAYVDNYYLMIMVELGLIFLISFSTYFTLCLSKAVTLIGKGELYRCNFGVTIFIFLISFFADTINSFPINFFFYGFIVLISSKENAFLIEKKCDS